MQRGRDLFTDIIALAGSSLRLKQFQPALADYCDEDIAGAQRLGEFLVES